MKILCNKCKVNSDIITYQEELKNLLIENDNDLLDKRVLASSEFISGEMSKCYFCKDNNLHKSRGKYIYENLYYFGKNHLFLNLYAYICEAINNKQLVYISVQRDIYERLIDVIMVNNVPDDNIKIKSLEDIQFIMDSPKYNIKEKANKFFNYENDKYNGVKWIIDADYVGKDFVEKDFFGINCKSREFVKKMHINILFAFDAYKWLSDDEKLIDEKVRKIDL